MLHDMDFFISHVCNADRYATSLAPLGFFCPRRLDSLLKAVVRPAHPLYWRWFKLPHGSFPIFMAPIGTVELIVLCDGKPIFIAPFTILILVDLSL